MIVFAGAQLTIMERRMTSIQIVKVFGVFRVGQHKTPIANFQKMLDVIPGPSKNGEVTIVFEAGISQS